MGDQKGEKVNPPDKNKLVKTRSNGKKEAGRQRSRKLLRELLWNDLAAFHIGIGCFYRAERNSEDASVSVLTVSRRGRHVANETQAWGRLHLRSRCDTEFPPTLIPNSSPPVIQASCSVFSQLTRSDAIICQQPSAPNNG